MSRDTRGMLADLVSIPSVNPMGRNIEGPHLFEGRVTDYLQSFFERLGVSWRRQVVHRGRENIVARCEGVDSDILLMLEAHQDTVPVDGMTIEPWTPTEKDGRLYGRGACDIKGGMAAMLAAFSRLVQQTSNRRPTVIMACTVNEEHGYTGATALCKLWESGEESIIPRRPDLAVIAEPTNLDVVVAHKGAVRWRCHTLGRAAHSSNPADGTNAVYEMGRVVLALEDYHARILKTLAVHPRCGRPTLSVGTIQGGLSVNTVPDRCTIEIDRRMVPGEDGDRAFAHVKEFLAEQAGIHGPVEHDNPFLVGSPLPDDNNGNVAMHLRNAVRTVAPEKGNVCGVPFGTDAAVYSKAGIPSVVFGPGSIQQAHTADEWVSLAEVELASEALFAFLNSDISSTVAE